MFFPEKVNVFLEAVVAPGFQDARFAGEECDIGALRVVWMQARPNTQDAAFQELRRLIPAMKVG